MPQWQAAVRVKLVTQSAETLAQVHKHNHQRYIEEKSTYSYITKFQVKNKSIRAAAVCVCVDGGVSFSMYTYGCCWLVGKIHAAAHWVNKQKTSISISDARGL